MTTLSSAALAGVASAAVPSAAAVPPPVRAFPHPATVVWFDVLPGSAGTDGGANAGQGLEPDTHMTASASARELHVASHHLPPYGETTFQYLRIYALGDRILTPGRFEIGRDVQVVLDNGTTCYASAGHLTVHELLTAAGQVVTAALSVRADYTDLPPWNVCRGESWFAEVRWRSAMPLLAPEHVGTVRPAQKVGTTSPVQQWTVRNEGTVPLHTRRLATGGADAGQLRVVSEDCSNRPLDPLQECTVEYTVQPTQVRYTDARIVLQDDSPRKARTLQVSAYGLP